MSSQQSEIVFPMHRTSDPETSRKASLKHTYENLSKRRQQTLRALLIHPGSTSGELSRMMFMKYSLPMRVAAETPHKRLPELEKLGMVRRGVARECKDSGYEAETWWPSAVAIAMWDRGTGE